MNSPLQAEKELLSIGEVSRLTGVKPYILRYWESKFHLVRPLRRSSGQRRFSRRDLETVQKVRDLIEEKGYTLEGARKHLRQAARAPQAQIPLEFAEATAAVGTLKQLKGEIEDLLKTLKSSTVAKPGRD